MAKAVVMPKMGMSMEEGTVVEWLKQEGDTVNKGEAIASISSEKIENEVEAPFDGVLISISAPVDSVVKVGEPIGYVGEAGEQAPHGEAPKSAESSEAETVNEHPKKEDTSVAVQTPAADDRSAGNGRHKASPAARKLAKSKGVDLSAVTGSGPNGRITKDDVLQAASGSVQTETEQPAIPLPDPEQLKAVRQQPAEKDFSGIRKVIGERMHESIQQSAQLTIMRYADVTELMAFRKKLNTELADAGVTGKATVTDMVCRAAVSALKEYPFMNSALIEDKIYEYPYVHLGIAAAMKRGLMVPVVFDADQLSLRELSAKIRQMADKVADGSIGSDELKGSTFTVTNLGASKVGFFTPILNPPETGILGVGAIEETAVFDGRRHKEALKLPLSLTFDHRIVDGEPAAQFLDAVIRRLEHPHVLVYEE
ncbi:dihydrolipoamide acetyltransferase family protein [Salisediminibacterium halotolerans]|uniref:Dihydrolipoamide acetyltransferase component of pyruvate dehydrogenase complex n=1 Tax=Salisediminibacterium halotolerans TaxID=517425 RepID=A0A1H9TV89_9BACI|nr:dihydrolipoamide acetyltransferase family protein [Salisediminibacterium haloalkalitolerans]SES00962.1 pyruvate dehydrogenase E2 component (dihydrolipoamide acetyltransferase) [Salisediminibacterium haloalkalitolerans]